MDSSPRPDPWAVEALGFVFAARPVLPADREEIVRLYGLRNWVEQSYKQAKQELGRADFQVRQDRAIRRHWELVCCAFSFCWWARFHGQEAAGVAPPEAEESPAERGDAGREPSRERREGSVAVGGESSTRTGSSAPGASPPPPASNSWPVSLRQVRGWLTPWSWLWRCWRAWSDLPPPPELQALLETVGMGRPLNLYLRC